jgi:uncharacterized membrane protein required for colicin V production
VVDADSMWLDLIALLVLACFATVGAFRGWITSLFGILSLASGYLAAIALAPVLGPPLAAALDVSELVAIPLAGTGLFFLCYGAVGITGKILARMTRKRGGERSARDRFLGGIFGTARGLLVVVLVSWLAVWVDALRASGVAPDLPSVGESTAASISSEIIETGLEAAFADAGTGGRVVARLAARPSMAATEIQAVVDSPAIEGLRADGLFWTYVEHGNVDAAMNRMAFAKLSRDDEMRRRLGDLGLVEEEAVEDPRAFREAFGAVLGEVGPRIKGLRDDPELKKLAEDPEVIAMVQRGDTLALIGHPGVQSIVGRVSSQTATTQ